MGQFNNGCGFTLRMDQSRMFKVFKLVKNRNFSASFRDQFCNFTLTWSMQWTWHDDVIKREHFHVTGPLWGESTCHRWIPLTKASDADIWCFLWSAPIQTVEQIIETLVIWDAIVLIMMRNGSWNDLENDVRYRKSNYLKSIQYSWSLDCYS